MTTLFVGPTSNTVASISVGSYTTTVSPSGRPSVAYWPASAGTYTGTVPVKWHSSDGTATTISGCNYPGLIISGVAELNYLRAVKQALTPDLLKPKYRAMWSLDNPHFGHCYHAAEALWHLLGGKASGYKPVRARDDDGITHWWLERKNQPVKPGARKCSGMLDPTVSQYSSVHKNPPYERGRGGGFLTKLPSRRAAEIIRRVLTAQRLHHIKTALST